MGALRWLFGVFLTVIALQAYATTYSLPSAIGSGPFSSCSLQSGSTYGCTAKVTLANGDIVNLTSSIILSISGNGFAAGNNVQINNNGSGYTIQIIATEDMDIGTSFAGVVSLQASGQTINIGNNASITGNITAGTINLGSGSSVTGVCTPTNSRCTGGSAPTVTTVAASAVTDIGATLNGTVSSNGASTTVTFDYGLTTSYGSSVTASQSPLASGASGTAVSAALTGLTCNTTYHFRVKGVNSTGTSNGGDLTFTTSTCMYFPVPISTGLLNQNITTWSGGSTYSPYMSGSQTLGGVPFTMQTSSTGMDVVWGTSTSVFSVPAGTTYTNTVTLNTNLYGATKVYTLINSAWGTAGRTVGSITFNASNGDSYTVSLVEGVNVRDHYYGSFVNTVSAGYVTTNVIGAASSGAHLDMQAFTLPSSFSTELLSSIVFTTSGSSSTGLPFLAGVTVKALGYGIDHVRLDHTGTGLTCTASTVTVTACVSADSNGSCTVTTFGISGNVYAKNGAGSTVATQGFTIPAGSSSTTVTMADATAETVTFSAGNYSILPASTTSTYSCWNSGSGSASCSHVYSNAGFIFSTAADGVSATIPAQVAGNSFGPYYLRAVKTNPTTKACEAALAGSNTVDFGYECNNPTTCSSGNLMSVNGGTSTPIAGNNNGAVSSYSAVNVTFDANGNAPFTLNFGDVGLVTLHARKTAGGALLSTLTGATNAFVVAPASFAFSGITGSPIKAGASFSATVTARASTGVATPNFGKESNAESATISLGSRVAPAGANDCTNGPCDGGMGGSVTPPWSGGAATASNLTYSEVGQITLKATLTSGSYLSSGLTATGTSAMVGDFVPAYFETAVTPGCGTFTYSGQPFSMVGVTARNAGGATTVNYSNLSGCTVCSKAVTLYDPTAVTNFNATNTIQSSAFAKGVGTGSAVTYTFPSRKTAPSTITLRAVDASVTPNVTSSGHTEGTAAIRSGRIRLLNAYGSELLDLPVSMHAEYWDGNTWTLNAADTCTGDTTLNANNGVTLALSNVTLDPTKTCVWDSASPGLSGAGCSTAGAASKKYKEGATPSVSFAGDFNLWLKAPGSGNSGAVGVTATVPSWLRYNWTGAVANPAARATFGVYKAPIIYMRENY